MKRRSFFAVLFAPLLARVWRSQREPITLADPVSIDIPMSAAELRVNRWTLNMPALQPGEVFTVNGKYMINAERG